MPSLQTLLMSPFLPGLVFIITALVTKIFPPKHINSFYGYRTPKSKSSEENWKIANTYSSTVLLISGIVLAFSGLLCTFLIPNTTTLSTITAISAITAAAAVLFLTERQLK